MEPFKEITQIGNKILPVKIFITELSPSCTYVPPHWHEFIEIIYFLQGDAKVQINSSYYDIRTGEIVLLNSLDVHAVYGFSKYLVLQFDTTIATDLPIEFNKLFPFNDDNKIIRQNKNYIDYLETIRHYMEDIISKYNTKPLGFEIDIRGSIYKILAAIIAYSQTTSKNEPSYRKHKENLQRLEKLLRYIDEHYNENITINDAANILNLAPNYFCRFFKSTMGKTFLEYLNFYRCSKAEMLINTTNIPITEIALLVGFSSIAYFNRVYKKYKGHSPSIERKKIILYK
ncbi:AraC family transcriptional regulator [Caloramator sp. mosi_1]|uniref:AraC family transcriptional regulator n=1 Tax=Caloramator sp. mosi_1 TaxID=3023090 RepID=UPI002362F2EF|nr:AraC family transcriptional regulator [Caloramator sp. mosi_1]WDC85430.1 AraC family transcriptional regulator [Caloramator sp. mosi_1]